MKKDRKKQKQITIRPSVIDKGKHLEKEMGAESFSDMLEKLILKKFNELEGE